MKKILLFTAMLFMNLGNAWAQEQGFNVYPYGKRTVFEFTEVPGSLTVRDEFGTEITYERISDKTFRFAKLMTNFSAVINGKKYRFINFKVVPDEIFERAPSVATTPQQPFAQSVPVAGSPVLVQVQTPNGPVAMYAYPAAPAMIQAPAPVAAKEPAQDKKSSRQWIIKAEHKYLRDLIEDWAQQAGYEVAWETRDFPLKVRADKVISNGSFLDALSVLGEAYRNSDAPFQIQPTAFQQIIVRPMTAQDAGE
ncbi:TcpQ domain-containing protein [Undibacterium sp. SXout7W]|uniref:TcpQ domain-containing protein n=1 Tax=Undibacterium sp. SXout7W TaxID=3413049 RepID=UPI003BF23373